MPDRRDQSEYNRRFTRRGEKINVFNKGAESDANPNLASFQEGKYIDGENFRLTNVGNEDVVRKIDGAQAIAFVSDDLFALNGQTGADYVFVGTAFCNDHYIAVCASTKTPTPDESFIAIDGRIVLLSADFPITAANPIQIDVNEGGDGGEIFLNNKTSKPLVFSVQDLLDEWNGGSRSTKYFADFDVDQYLVQTNTPMDQPVFVRLENVGGTTGLPPGGYSYSLRLIDDDGNGTSWGPSTPIIPVVENVSAIGKQYKGINTHGKIPDPTINTRYGVRLRIRVTNEGDFAAMEIRRVAHISGQDFISSPQPEKIIVSEVDIRATPYTIIDFIDTSNKAWSLVDDFSDEDIAVVEKVNTVKYFDNRLTLHGPTYKTKVVDDTSLFLENEEGNIAHPFIADLDEIGFNNIWNQVYRKGYMHGERYGWAALCFDGTGGRAFALPYKSGTTSGVDDFTNYMIPNRRDPVGQDTSDFSESLVTCADKYSNAGASVSETHEVLDNTGTIYKEQDPYVGFINTIKDNSVGFNYYPFSPTGAESTTKWKYDLSGHDQVICSEARHNSTDYYPNANYHPEGWGHKIHSQGMMFRGVDETKLPNHIKSFSIVRTPPAKRVLCQGIGFYNLEEQAVGPIYKSLSKVWFYSPDIDQNIGNNPQLFDDIINNPGSYKVQLVSPVGFFTEVFGGDIYSGQGIVVDIISYAKILYENNKFNYGDVAANIGRGNGYVGFGRWRNTSAGGATGVESDTTENYIYTINGAEQVSIEGHEGRSVYLELSISTAIGDTHLYKTVSAGLGTEDFDDTFMRDYHEPLYIINIINENAEVPAEYITEYIDTGHHQKLSSLIGYGNGIEGQQFPLVDERPEDCGWDTHKFSVGTHTGANGQATLTDSNAAWTTNELIGYYIRNLTDGSNSMITGNTSITVTCSLSGGAKWDTNEIYEILCPKYVYVNGKPWWALPNGAVFPTPYLNCMTSLAAIGYWNDGNRNVYGVCVCYQETGIGGEQDKTIIWFSRDRLDAIYPGTTGYNASFYVPAEDAKIEVRYDNRAPLKVFGGDTFIGDALFVPVDSYINQELTYPEDSCFKMHIGWPYYYYRNGLIFQLSKSDPFTVLGPGQYIGINYVRQLALLFTCESRVNLSLMYNDSFPKKNYVQRPINVDVTNWDDGPDAVYNDHRFFKEYRDDYGDEYLTWLYGGFHFPGSSNIDYSKYLNDRKSYSKPLVGFTEKLYFPDRTIHSLKRKTPGEIDSLRVFPALNSFDGKDFTGAITYAWVANTPKGDNLYKFTKRGICLMLTDKNILQDLTGGEIGILGSSESFIQAEYWLSRNTGMNDEMWRSAAEFENSLLFANSESVYLFQNNEVIDIATERGYFSKLYNKGLLAISSGFGSEVHGVIDRKHKEYWLALKNVGAIASFEIGGAGTVVAITTTVVINTLIDGQRVTILNGSTGNYDGEHEITINGYNSFRFTETWAGTETAEFHSYVQFVFNYKLGVWTGRYRHQYNSYTYNKYNVYGHVNGDILSTLPVFELNSGNSTGDVTDAYVIVAVVPEFGGRVEFKSVEVFSDIKPISIEFAMTEEGLFSGGAAEAILDSTTFGSYYLKDMAGSFKNKIPRKITGDRFQGQLLFIKINDTATTTRTNIVSVVTGYDKLKS